ncbi:MAG: arginine deiminase [Bacteroidales bacterium]|nr:arginine deiminase [Bacteroidales bacterium]
MNQVEVNSEIGRLEGVILHTPGIEIERMIPDNIHEALYSDLLNLKIAQKEYGKFSGVLSKWTQCYQVVELLEKVLETPAAKQELLQQILSSVDKMFLYDELLAVHAPELAHYLIEGYPYMDGRHPANYRGKRFILNPLYNFFFTRDASSSMYSKVFIHCMSTAVRDPESYIMEAIFKYVFHTETISPREFEGAHTEGGDMLIARDDVIFLGNGCRTNDRGVAFLTQYFASQNIKQHIVVQQLPFEPDSFIHLDMVFTMLSQDKCMVFEPLILSSNSGYKTVHIEIDHGQVHYHERKNFMEATKLLGFDLEPVKCGGDDLWYQHREQWHSGANFFALGEGKVLGYARNWNTIEALNKAGFDVLPAEDVCSGKISMDDHQRFVVTFDAAELPRGGGGARCMTMPVKRQPVRW